MSPAPCAPRAAILPTAGAPSAPSKTAAVAGPAPSARSSASSTPCLFSSPNSHPMPICSLTFPHSPPYLHNDLQSFPEKWCAVPSRCPKSGNLQLTILQLRMKAPHYNRFVLPESQRDLLDVVLVSPRNPLNIGAAARAMANFGFQRLSVVAPFDPTWREARSAIGAPDLLLNAVESSTFAEAVADCTLVAGTGTLTWRKPEQPVIQLPELAPLVSQELARGGRVALIFGSEKHGLTREDLSYCHLLVEIPTDPLQPSMNLGQAVAVCLYELIRSAESAPTTPVPSVTSSAPSGRLDLLAWVIEEAMQAVGYSPRAMQPANRHDLRLLLRRLSLSAHDTRRILGLFRRILWRINHLVR